ncbi:hypothetical protein KEM55_002694 [Ascosphaera atra]|nr:hypothetical protein KEM55_002694 [Ascosphaera atra]
MLLLLLLAEQLASKELLDVKSSFALLRMVAVTVAAGALAERAEGVLQEGAAKMVRPWKALVITVEGVGGQLR